MAIRRRRYAYQCQAGPTTAYNTLLNNAITSYWKADEAGSVTRNDSVTTNNLAVTGTVNSAAGKINNGITLGGVGGNYLSIADNASLNVGTSSSFFAWGWVQMASTAATMNWLHKGSANTAATYVWRFTFNTGTNLGIDISNGSATTRVGANPGSNFPSLAAYATGTWYLVYGGWNGSTGYFGINNLDASTGGKFVFSAATSPLDSGTFPFIAGQGGTGGAAPWNGLVDEWGFSKGRAMTDADVNLIYASGNGKQYPY